MKTTIEEQEFRSIIRKKLIEKAGESGEKGLTQSQAQARERVGASEQDKKDFLDANQIKKSRNPTPEEANIEYRQGGPSQIEKDLEADKDKLVVISFKTGKDPARYAHNTKNGKFWWSKNDDTSWQELKKDKSKTAIRNAWKNFKNDSLKFGTKPEDLEEKEYGKIWGSQASRGNFPDEAERVRIFQKVAKRLATEEEESPTSSPPPSAPSSNSADTTKPKPETNKPEEKPPENEAKPEKKEPEPEESGAGGEPVEDETLTLYTINFPNGEKAINIRLPRSYYEFTGGRIIKHDLLGNPRVMKKINRYARTVDSNTLFNVRFGNYPGRPKKGSIFQNRKIDLKDLKSFVISGPKLGIGAIRGTKLHDFYKIAKAIGDKLKPLRGENSNLDAIRNKYKSLAEEMEEDIYDVLKVRVAGEPNIKLARFTGNKAPKNFKELENLRIYKFNFDEFLEKVKDARKATGTQATADAAEKIVKLFNFQDMNESFSPESELFKIINSTLNLENSKKKRIHEKITGRDFGQGYDSISTATIRIKPKGSMYGQILAGLAANEVLDRILEKGDGMVYIETPLPEGISPPVGGTSFKITRDHNDPRSYGPHGALDIRSRTPGKPILSIGAGIVKKVVNVEPGDENKNYQNLSYIDACGCLVEIEHNPPIMLKDENGEEKSSITTSKYCHLSKITVSKGDNVQPGDIIGESGGDPEDQPCAGNTSAPHLHFSIGGSGDMNTRYGSYLLALTGGSNEAEDSSSDEVNPDEAE